MASIEAAGTVLSLVGLISAILEPIQQLQYDLKALKSLQIELSALFEVLNALQPLVESPSGKKISIPQDLFVSCRDTLVEIQRIIDAVTSKPPSRYVALALRFKHQQPLKQLKEDLDRHKATFSIILTSITSLQANVTENEIRGLREKIDELHRANEIRDLHDKVDELHRANKLQLREKTLAWISSYDYQARYMDLSDKRLDRTGSWLFDTKEYQMWEAGKSPFFLLEGRAGTGKSVMMSSIVSRLRSIEANTDQTAVIYFFNDFREQGSGAMTRLVASLLRQIVQCLPSLPHSIVHGYETAGNIGRPPTLSFLKTQLLHIIRAFERVYVLVDGFDELPRDARSELTELAHSLVKFNTYVTISSRPVLDLPQPKHDGDSAPVLVRLEDQQSADIDNYIKQELSKIKQLTSKPDLREDIRKELVKHANGMFLWVTVTLKGLSRSRTPKAIQQTLLKLPQDLADVYDGLLLEISRNQEQFNLARQVLQCVISAEAPLTLSDVARIILSDPNQNGFQRIETHMIEELCGGFVSIEPATEQIRLAHFSVQEYLLNSDSLKRLAVTEASDENASPIRSDRQADRDQTDRLPSLVPQWSSIEYSHDAGSDDSDSASVKSWSSSVLSHRSETSSQASILSQLVSVTDQYANLFAHHERSRPVILACLGRLGVTGFEHEFADTLIAYSADLRRLARTGSQNIAAIMAGQKTRTIARQTLIMSGFLDKHQISTRIVKHAGNPRSDATIDRILGLRDQSSGLPRDAEAFKFVSFTSRGEQTDTRHQGDMERGSEGLSRLEQLDDLDEDCAQIYQNLDLVKDFLTSTEAFDKLLHRLQNCMLPSMLSHTVSKPSDSESTLEAPDSALDVLKRWVWKFLQSVLNPERSLEPGMKRVRWTCVCDRQLYDDFLEIVPGAVDELQASLESIYKEPASGIAPRLALPRSTGSDPEVRPGDVRLKALLPEKGDEDEVSRNDRLLHDGRHSASSSRSSSSTGRRSQARPRRAATRSDEDGSEKHDSIERLAGQGNGGGSTELHQLGRLERGGTEAESTDMPDRRDQQQQEGLGDTQDGVVAQERVRQSEVEQEQGPHTDLWILPCFRIARTGHTAKHISVDEHTCDSHLFGEFRHKYFMEKSWLRRFVELKEVSKLDFVQFNLTDLQHASIIKYDVWPPQEVSTAVLPPPDLTKQWHYKPCPVKQIPLVGTDHLLHIWRNPHHADRSAYREWEKSVGFFRRTLEWMRHWPARVRQRFFGVSLPRNSSQVLVAAQRGEPNQQSRPPSVRSRYITVKIPKKIGGQLAYDLGNDDPIPGWGLRFEESFCVHRLLFALLLFYFMISMAFIIWYLVTKGLPAVQTWTEISGLLSWVGGFLALLFTVWFKWTENP